jgi:hypothetical protein
MREEGTTPDRPVSAYEQDQAMLDAVEGAIKRLRGALRYSKDGSRVGGLYMSIKKDFVTFPLDENYNGTAPTGGIHITVGFNPPESETP